MTGSAPGRERDLIGFPSCRTDRRRNRHGNAGRYRPGAARLVSVIIPTNNRPARLRETLKTIHALEGPDLAFEILIGDNGNAPDTPVVAKEFVAKEFGARYLKTDKPGAGSARNLGLRAATGEYFAVSDDDDA